MALASSVKRSTMTAVCTSGYCHDYLATFFFQISFLDAVCPIFISTCMLLTSWCLNVFLWVLGDCTAQRCAVQCWVLLMWNNAVICYMTFVDLIPVAKLYPIIWTCVISPCEIFNLTLHLTWILHLFCMHILHICQIIAEWSLSTRAWCNAPNRNKGEGNIVGLVNWR